LENKTIITIVRWLIVILIPFMLTLGTVRALIAWDYPSFEYSRIPPDSFGFTPQERLDFAHATLDYLQRSEPASEVIHLIEDLRLPGTDEPLYNSREIGHMLDVKIIADVFRRLFWILLFIILASLVLLLSRPGTRLVGYRAIFQGGVLTTVILIGMMILVGLAWSFVFTQFHELLFPPETWTFLNTDSLIRLFPEKFWFDFGILWTGSILVEGIVTAIIGYGLVRSA
jgi:integral membrane protein (TIGR01906 family)